LGAASDVKGKFVNTLRTVRTVRTDGVTERRRASPPSVL